MLQAVALDAWDDFYRKVNSFDQNHLDRRNALNKIHHEARIQAGLS
jgi:hypothetical protein